jgi:hypothetical protein
MVMASRLPLHQERKEDPADGGRDERQRHSWNALGKPSAFRLRALLVPAGAAASITMSHS